jgi:hypothetical protein
LRQHHPLSPPEISGVLGGNSERLGGKKERKKKSSKQATYTSESYVDDLMSTCAKTPPIWTLLGLSVIVYKNLCMTHFRGSMLYKQAREFRALIIVNTPHRLNI